MSAVIDANCLCRGLIRVTPTCTFWPKWATFGHVADMSPTFRQHSQLSSIPQESTSGSPPLGSRGAGQCTNPSRDMDGHIRRLHHPLLGPGQGQVNDSNKQEHQHPLDTNFVRNQDLSSVLSNNLSPQSMHLQLLWGACITATRSSRKFK